MPVVKVKYQSRNSIKEFYLDKRWEGLHNEISNDMLEIIGLINEIFDVEKLYAYTSHQALHLVNGCEDNSFGVQFDSRPPCISIGYQLPVDEQPWENATVWGDICRLTEEDKLHFPQNFKRYLVTAMIRSKLWDDNIPISTKLQSFIDES